MEKLFLWAFAFIGYHTQHLYIGLPMMEPSP